MLASHDDAMREYAWNAGRDRPDLGWILTPYDVWMPNPFFVGEHKAHPDMEDALW